MVGVLQVNPDGFGYLLNESGDGLGDLYISAENQGTRCIRTVWSPGLFETGFFRIAGAGVARTGKAG